MHILSFEDASKAGTPYADCVVIFLGLEVPESVSIDHAYFIWTETHVPPTTTLIIGRKDKLLEFHSKHVLPTGRLKELDRLYGYQCTNNVILAGFDSTGTVATICNGDAEPQNLTNIFNDIVRTYIEQRCDDSDVIIPAPPGTYFDKQSTRLSSHFIRAEALLHSTEAIEMLALRLLHPFHEWWSKLPNKTAQGLTIYIDTMSVWPIAEKLRQLHEVDNLDATTLRIESFKSYDGLDNWHPLPRPAFVIISASTSGGLAQRVKKKISSTNTAVWTMLALAPAILAEPLPNEHIALIPRSLTGRPSLNGLRSTFEVDVTSPPPGTETICIVGERFLSQPAKPKRVRLIHKNLDAEAKRTLAKIARQGIVNVGQGRFDAKSRWALSFDLSALIKSACTPQDDKTDSLLKSWLRNYSSPSPVAVIYPSPEGQSAKLVTKAAEDLAEYTAATLKEFSPGATVFILSSAELARASKPPPHDLASCSIIVVCPVIGNGFILKQISALLRNKQPTGPRLYLTLAALPESDEHLKQLKLDIASVNSDDSRYEFRCQYAFSIGRLDKAINWRAEIDILEELQRRLTTEGKPSSWIKSRLNSIEQLRPLDGDAIFFPSAHDKPLPLSTGFLLWEGSFDIHGNNFGAAVILSISALLQAARVAKSKSDDTSLRTGLFQHALICPESFTRFNDPVIQAAILRAAYPPELNYSVSPQMSYDMARLLQKWIQYYADPAGAAAGEFLLAIALGKLKLCEDDIQSVLVSASKCTGWLKNLADIAQSRLYPTTSITTLT